MGTFNRQLWSSVLSFLLVMTGTQAVGVKTSKRFRATLRDPSVSPIALYPDAVVAQILAASTFPDQVAVADNWPQQNTPQTGMTLMQAVSPGTRA